MGAYTHLSHRSNAVEPIRDRRTGDRHQCQVPLGSSVTLSHVQARLSSPLIDLGRVEGLPIALNLSVVWEALDMGQAHNHSCQR